VLEIPGVDNVIGKFFEPTFADSRLFTHEPANGTAWTGLLIGAAIAVAGIAIAYRIWVGDPGIATRLRERLRPLHSFLSHKWYFDELIQFGFVWPALAVGRLAETVFERVVVNGVITNGTVRVVRATSALVRRAQTGFLRYYAAFMVVGIAGVAFYYLVSTS
jgi:NADH-quinone oxidoreductase subunit L